MKLGGSRPERMEFGVPWLGQRKVGDSGMRRRELGGSRLGRRDLSGFKLQCTYDAAPGGQMLCQDQWNERARQLQVKTEEARRLQTGTV